MTNIVYNENNNLIFNNLFICNRNNIPLKLTQQEWDSLLDIDPYSTEKLLSNLLKIKHDIHPTQKSHLMDSNR